MKNLARLHALILPGILMAMTGVGVGDLATAGFTGAQLGVTVLWAVALGGIFKYALTEGVARWQLASGESVFATLATRFRWPFVVFMLIYFLPWCWFVGGAIMNASGVAGAELIGRLGIDTDKPIAAIVQSLLVAALILFGHHRWVNRVMSLLAVVLFVTVFVCVLSVPIDLASVLRGLLLPSIPDKPQSLIWTLALMGGVGGTLTILCYGYWMAQSDRSGLAGLKTSRWDLAISYTLTCLFGMAMVIIGSVAVQEGKGLGLLLSVSQYFSQNVHEILGLLFLVGAWAAIISSMLGVWQAVPYLFTDAMLSLSERTRGDRASIQYESHRFYRFGVLFLTLVPLLSLVMPFKEIQKLYSFVGALFMPVLAITLLWLNNKWVTAEFRNSQWINIMLICVFLFFAFVPWIG